MNTRRSLLHGAVAAAIALTFAPSPAAAQGNDAGAGSWQLIGLSSPADFQIPAPQATSSQAYQSELAAIRSAQSQLTDAQRNAIEYWSAQCATQ